MDWLAANGVDVTGHAITIAIFLAGFLKLRHEWKLDIAKDHNIKNYEMRVQAIVDSATLMEQVRLAMWMLAIQPFDPDKPLDKDTQQRLEAIGALRANWFKATVFVPEELRQDIEMVNTAFNRFNDVVSVKDLKEKERANQKVSDAVAQWRAKAQDWANREWERVKP